MYDSYQQKSARSRTVCRFVISWALISGIAMVVSETAVAQDSDQSPRPQPQYRVIERLKVPKVPIQQLQTLPSGQGQQQTQGSSSAALGTRSAYNGVTAYLRVDGIGGAATHQSYRGWIRLLGFEDGIVSDVSQSGRGTTRRHVKPLTVSKAMDASSVPLRDYAIAGRFIPRVELALHVDAGAGGFELHRLVLDQVTVARIETTLRQGSAVEDVDFSFAKISWRYNLIDQRGTHQGSLVGCWDVNANRGC